MTALSGLLSAVVGPLSAVVGLLSAVVGPLSAVVGPLSAVSGPLSAVVGPLSAVSGPLSAVVSLIFLINHFIARFTEYQVGQRKKVRLHLPINCLKQHIIYHITFSINYL
jgi:hypothetical protein